MKAGIYIHVPFCAKKCPYCDFYSVSYRADAAERYTDAVCRNLAALPANLSVDTVYFGGGTPSILPLAQIRRILSELSAHCDLSDDTEITLEANPLTMTPARLAAWHEAGINRLSVGVQSFQGDVLRQLGRQHSPEQAADALRHAADAGFSNLSLDLMIGLAVQNPHLLDADIQAALSLPVSHISAYLLKIEEGTPFASDAPPLLSEDDLAARYLQLHTSLTEAGFSHYEISNFAKPGYESRHNRKYWLCAPYYGIGPAAHSQNSGLRYAVPDDVNLFIQSPVQQTEVTDINPLTDSERIMLGLRLHEGVDLNAYPDSRERILKAAAPYIPKYLTVNGSCLTMTPEGWLLQNAILVRILPDEEA